MNQSKFAPKEVFDQMLEWMVIPTFDLIIEYGDQGFVVVKRKIAPYNNQWALPGLRMYKGEEISDTLARIAKQELGLDIDPKNGRYIGQYVGKFKTEHQRHDLSTCYAVSVAAEQEIILNADHFTSYKISKTIPAPMGAMYKFYLDTYFKQNAFR